MKLLTWKIIFLLLSFSINAFAEEIPSPSLCQVMFQFGASKTSVENFFTGSADSIFHRLDQNLKDKLIQTAKHQLSTKKRNHSGDIVFTLTAESWGYQAVGKLYALGLTVDEIKEISAPLVQKYIEEKVTPGFKMLSGGKDFRDYENTNFISNDSSTDITIVKVKDGQIISGNKQVANSFFQLKDRMQIDNSFSETNAEILGEVAEIMMFAGHEDEARKVLKYMMLLSPEDSAVVTLMEKLENDEMILMYAKVLWNHHAKLLEQKTDITELESIKLKRLYDNIIRSVSRIKSPDIKEQSFHMMSAIITKFANDPIVPHNATDNSWQQKYYNDYGMALNAIQALGRETSREFIDSDAVELTFDSSNLPKAIKTIIGMIAFEMGKFDYRLKDSSYDQLIRTLISIKDNKSLEILGDRSMERRSDNPDSWYPISLYENALDYYIAAQKVNVDNRNHLQSKIDSVFEAIFEGFKVVRSFDRDNRYTIPLSDLNHWYSYAFVTKNEKAITRIESIAQTYGMKLELTNKIGKLDIKRHPFIPKGAQDIMTFEDNAKHNLEYSKRAMNEKSEVYLPELLNDVKNGEDFDVDQAVTVFSHYENVEGMEAIGDRYLERLNSPETFEMLDASAAFTYYLMSAILKDQQ